MFNIGHTGTSKTLFPQYVESPNGTLYIDLPGINDTRGRGIAFVNAICIKNILIQAKSVKFLFVETQGAFETERGEAFKNLLQTIFKIIPNKKLLIQSSLFIVAKADKKQQKIIINNNILPNAPKEFFQIFPLSLLQKRVIPFVKPNYFMDINNDSDASDN